MMERSYYQPATIAEPNQERGKLRDNLFNQLVAAQVLDGFTDDLGNADFPEDAFVEFEKAFGALSEEDKRAVLAVPAQLRVPLFSKYTREVNLHQMSGTGVLQDMLRVAKERGYTLGFHLSLYDIRPAKDGSWYVRGTEPDHRHQDIPMAYYSMDYRNRYKQKRVNYLYVIRAETGDGTSHFRDNDGSWGHASSLSIISKIDLREVEKTLSTRLKEIETKEGEDAESAPSPTHEFI